MALVPISSMHLAAVLRLPEMPAFLIPPAILLAPWNGNSAQVPSIFRVTSSLRQLAGWFWHYIPVLFSPRSPQ
jgi:hypothetical protein